MNYKAANLEKKTFKKRDRFFGINTSIMKHGYGDGPTNSQNSDIVTVVKKSQQSLLVYSNVPKCSLHSPWLRLEPYGWVPTSHGTWSWWRWIALSWCFLPAAGDSGRISVVRSVTSRLTWTVRWWRVWILQFGRCTSLLSLSIPSSLTSPESDRSAVASWRHLGFIKKI